MVGFQPLANQLEQWWIGTILGRPEQAVRWLAELPLDVLQDARVRQVAQGIAEWVANGRRWELADAVARWPEWAADLMAWANEALVTAPYPDLLADQLRQHALRERTRQILQQGLADLERTADATPAPRIVAALEALVRDHQTVAVWEPDEAARRVEDWLERRQALDRTPVLTTPWPYLSQTGGGLGPDELIVVAARPGVGKTSFALQLATHVAERGTPTLVVSLEMTPERCLAQILAQRFGFDRYRLTHTKLQEAEWAHVTRATGTVRTWPLYWWARSERPTFEAIAAAVARLAARQPPLQVLVVDYLDLVPLPGRRGRPEELGDLTYAFKFLAGRYQLSVVLCQQLSRAVEQEKRPPQLSDLRWSGGVEQAADKVWMLQELPDGTRRCWIRKHREGPLGVVDLAWDGARSRLVQAVEQPMWEQEGSERG
ncbi:MAG: DnaB-like helicase C-terminal domain-containing protein [Actinomycetia bacterium]|nr:DnaB-like helicase C-terminal domain-containing protein [Actinomycetes bacterium]